MKSNSALYVTHIDDDCRDERNSPGMDDNWPTNPEASVPNHDRRWLHNILHHMFAIGNQRRKIPE